MPQARRLLSSARRVTLRTGRPGSRQRRLSETWGLSRPRMTLLRPPWRAASRRGAAVWEVGGSVVDDADGP